MPNKIIVKYDAGYQKEKLITKKQKTTYMCHI